MERRHIPEGGKRVAARQKALVGELVVKRRDRYASIASELLGVLQESLELSRSRLRELESRFEEPSIEIQTSSKTRGLESAAAQH